MKKIRLSALTKFGLVVAFILLTTAFTEAGDSRDINDKLIVTNIAVDKKDGEIWFYLEFANIQQGQSSGGGGGSGQQYSTVKGRGKTLTEARANLNRQLDKPIFLSTARTLLLTEDFAREHLVEYLYRRSGERRTRKR